MSLLRPSPVAGRGAVPLPPPPAYLRLPDSDILWAAKTTEIPHAGVRTRKTGAQKAGLAYQRKVENYLTLHRRGGALDVGSWFVYACSDYRRRYCQPDVLIHGTGGFAGRISVVEIKIRWTADAWWQLRKLYLPVLNRAFPTATLVPLVICRSYDPAIRIAEPVRFVDCVEDAAVDAFNVLVHRP